MTAKTTPLFEKPQDEPTQYDGLLGWSAGWKCYLDPKQKPVPLDEIESLNPDSDTVTIRRGDTLSKIAKNNNCTVDAIAKLNGIKNPELIYPGQVLKIPTHQYIQSEDDGRGNNNKCELSFTFEDLIDKPISDLKVKIVSAAGEVYDSVTDGMGKIEKFIINSEAEVQVFVSSAVGKIKEIASFTPMLGKTDVILSSPKVRVKGKSAAIKGEPGNVDRDRHDVNTVSVGRDSQGNPSLQLNHVCPNSYDLSLGKNVIYWDQIIAASRRSGFIPQSIAAVINAESAKYPGGVWRPDSVCFDSGKIRAEKRRRERQGLNTDNVVFYRSSAAGMTQFLNLTWIGEGLRNGTYLYEKLKATGIVAEKPSLDRHGRERVRRDGSPILENKFQILPNVWKNLNEIKRGGYTGGGVPYPSRATQAIQNCLNLRFKAEYAIMAAVDYGLNNLDSLKELDYKIDVLNDAEKAKMIYLTHHLGLTDAVRFIKNTITEESAEKLLIAQVGGGDARVRANLYNGSYKKAHRAWLIKFINDNIAIKLFYCAEKTQVEVRDVDLKSVMEKL